MIAPQLRILPVRPKDGDLVLYLNHYYGVVNRINFFDVLHEGAKRGERGWSF